jgi:hypothetical protein
LAHGPRSRFLLFMQCEGYGFKSILSKWWTICCWPILTVAMVPAQDGAVCELGVVQGAQTSNRRAPILARDHAPSAKGNRP